MKVVFSLHGLDYDFFMGGAECAFVGVKTACHTSANIVPSFLPWLAPELHVPLILSYLLLKLES